MQKNLVIVESPAKAKTIEKFLGKDYKVMSSYGHIRDLKTKEFSIDIEHDYAPQYVIPADKKKLVSELKSEAKSAEQVWLASDEDREGEAISWHLYEVLGLKPENTKRIVFHEITKNAILHAIETPRDININLVNAQQARRVLDRIVGFELSPILWRKVKPALSAGRVQSVAVRLIVEREREINEFVSEAAFRVIANFILPDGTTVLKAELNRRLKDKKEVEAFLESCKNASFTIDDITTKPVKKSPAPPFTTSTLQQEASTKCNFGARKTMSIAQRLYEGIDLGGSMEGLISYMRTDSTRLSPLFVEESEKFIEEEYGKEYVGKAHQKNSANAQDAHEAIRPTNIHRTPESVKSYLTAEQYRLYSLIYARTLASLMKEAKFDVTTVSILNNGVEFKASGQVMTFDGYTKVYSKYEKTSDEYLPALEEKEVLKDVKVEGKQHFTEPPARYTEAKLIKELEEKSIGRPSTYATIIDTIQKRNYVVLEKTSETSRTKVFIPTEQGILTDEKLQQYFSSVINVEYTANMEKTLDEIAEGKQDNIAYLHQFYDFFQPLVLDAYDKMPKKELERVGRTCPDCGGELVYRNGRFGKFISCINFPTCKHTENLEVPKEAEGQEKVCPKCGAKMVIKRGRYGQFWACSNYPECKTIVPLKEKAKPEPIGEKCPECGHELVRRKSRYGTTFIGCSNYPKCHYIRKEPKKKKEEETKE